MTLSKLILKSKYHLSFLRSSKTPFSFLLLKLKLLLKLMFCSYYYKSSYTFFKKYIHLNKCGRASGLCFRSWLFNFARGNLLQFIQKQTEPIQIFPYKFKHRLGVSLVLLRTLLSLGRMKKNAAVLKTHLK